MEELLARIHPVTTRRAPVSTESLARFEAAWGRLPSGYRELMAELGVGTLTGWVRVYSPERIAVADLLRRPLANRAALRHR